MRLNAKAKRCKANILQMGLQGKDPTRWLNRKKYWRLWQMDFKNAFLHGELDKDIYIEQPRGFKNKIHPEYVYKLKKKYAKDLLQRYGMLNCKLISTPMDPNIQLQADEGKKLEDVTMYRQLVRNLIYLTLSRPDITYAVGVASQYMSNPKKPHLDAVRFDYAGDYAIINNWVHLQPWIKSNIMVQQETTNNVIIKQRSRILIGNIISTREYLAKTTDGRSSSANRLSSKASLR
ncbi:hypothetical protein CXB51_004789 [Gossypium anomalum]|uniref:Reverse transcriptase Ty1/copia-type domain-containing protein n=1 Tax=Gossypium anomalum TaxID=47600 RepID=A0A8J5Z6P8_9ROSI|nr:hypothetical protein CXB51_004789 [Gossypium anomalum]